MLTRAIVLASDGGKAGGGAQQLPGCLDLLVDRPWLHHVVEQLARGGIRDVDVLASEGADEISGELGSGERWGLNIQCHGDGGPEGSPDPLSHLSAQAQVLLADARSLVPADVWKNLRNDRNSLAFYHRPRACPSGIQLDWTGWCRGRGQVLVEALSRRPRGDLLTALMELAGTTSCRICLALIVREPQDLLDANGMVLAGKVPYVTLRGRAAARGVWKERGVRVHATARLIEPVYLGEHSEVGREATLGPNVVLGTGCIVAARATARDCVVTAATYVGPGTRCEQLVGLRSGAFRHARGDAVSGALRLSLIDLRGASLLAGAFRGLRRWLALLIALPARIARSCADRLAPAAVAASAVLDCDEHEGTAASH